MQWVGKGELRPKKARMSKSQMKTMLIAFFDRDGLVHHEYLPPKTTLNADRYCNILRHLQDRVRRIRPQFWADQDWVLHQDNAPIHTAVKICTFLAKHCLPVLDHPPYSLDLGPCDFFLFPRLKNVLKGHHFGGLEEIKRNATATLKAISKEEFAACFQQWKHRMEKCVTSGGNYFEGDKLE